MSFIDLNNYHYHITPEDLRARVLFKDAHLMVINKPAGITVHPGSRGAPSLEDHFAELMFERREVPQLAHRLDRDTSGCLILSRRQSARSKLGKLFESSSIEKTYWAIVHGSPQEDSGIIDNYLKKMKDEKGWYVKICAANAADAKRATTEWKVMQRYNGYSWLELKPKTGRTHQIRIHCLSLGCPIIGDWVYGAAAPEGETLPLLHLHARAVKIPFHHDETPIFIEAPMPEHMAGKIDMAQD